MKKLTLLYTALLLLLAARPALAATGIANSAHDLSKESWNLKHDLCGPCHMAHTSRDATDHLLPLWSHASTPRTFTPFTSPTLVAAGVTIPAPSGSSKACLSCHDGSLAVNQFGKISGGTTPVGGTARMINSDYLIGANGDLRGDHPVSFVYDSTLSQNIPFNALFDPHTTLLNLPASGNNLRGQTIEAGLLRPDPVTGQSMLQCLSCHDVHRQRGDSMVNSDANLSSPNHNPLLVITGLGSDGTGSALCRSCHNK